MISEVKNEKALGEYKRFITTDRDHIIHKYLVVASTIVSPTKLWRLDLCIQRVCSH